MLLGRSDARAGRARAGGRSSMTAAFTTLITLGLSLIAASHAAAQGPRAFVLSNDTLIAIDTANPSSPRPPLPVTGLNAGDTLVGIDFRPQNGFLYGLGYNSGAHTVQLYALSVRTGVAAPVGTTGTFVSGGGTPLQISGTSFGFDFNPALDRIRVVNDAGQNFRMNPNTGAFVDGDMSGPPGSVVGLNMDGAIIGGTTAVDGAAHTNNAQNATITTLYTLDAMSNALFRQSPPNNGTQASPLTVTLGGNPVDFTSASGFDIAPGVNAPANNASTTGPAFAALTVGGVSSLYSIELSTGSATLLGTIGNGTMAIQGLAVQGEAIAGGLPAIGVDGGLLRRFNTASAGSYLAPGVGGMASGETLAGIDWRPQTGQLFGLGFNASSGTGSATLYLLDPQTGAATVVGFIGSIANGIGMPISLAGATAFGFDFDPTADRIRVVTDNGLNFRIVPTTGGVVNNALDPAINGLPNGAIGVTGAAYTNSYGQAAGAGATTLYTLDPVNNALSIQNPQNGGTQTPVATMNAGDPVDIENVGGFDIPAAVGVGASNAAAIGSGYVAMTVDGVDGFYRIDLTTGSVSTLDTTTSRLTGLAVGDGAPGHTITTVTTSVDPATTFQTVTFTATVSQPAATGTISFSADGAPIAGCSARPVSAGVATCDTSFSVSGTPAIAASYSGDDELLASISAPSFSQAVVPTPTATMLSIVPNSVSPGEPVTFTATVMTNPLMTVDGLVTFMLDGHPAGVVSLVSSTASLSLSPGAGVHTVSSSYAGTTAFAASVSTAGQLIVRTPTAISVVASDQIGTAATLTATVTPAGATGTVLFLQDGDVLGTAPLVGGQASLAQQRLLEGERQITAEYSGDTLFLQSSSTPLTLTLSLFRQYFAEGATGFFHTDVGIVNPSRTDRASVSLTLFPEGGDPLAQQFWLEPLQRRTVNLAEHVGAGVSVSALFESTLPVATMRQTTWGDPVYGSTLESGIPNTSTTWHFAEGATSAFSLFYLVENPGATPANVRLTHLLEGGAAPVTQDEVVPPLSRRTYYINDVPGLNPAALSTVITSDVPIVAERAMYLNDAARQWEGGTAGRGATALSTAWSFAEGATGFFHTYLLLGNPGADAAEVTVHYLLPSGETVSKTYTVAGQSRRTVDVASEDARLSVASFGVSLTSSLPIVAERAMWWGSPWIEGPWTEGSVALGSTETGTEWAIGEGAEGGPSKESTFVLVANASATAGTIRFTVVYDDGTSETKDYALAGDARLTVRIADDFAKAIGQKFSILVESQTTGVPITVECARYQSVGAFGAAGGAASATKIK